MIWLATIIQLSLIIGCLVFILVSKKKHRVILYLSILFIMLWIAQITNGLVLRNQIFNLQGTIITEQLSVVLSVAKYLVAVVITIYYIVKMIKHKKRDIA